MASQKEWHVDSKGKFVHPKRKGGKFASKKDTDGGEGGEGSSKPRRSLAKSPTKKPDC